MTTLQSQSHGIFVGTLFIFALLSPLAIGPSAAERVVRPTWDRTYLSVVPGTSSVEQTSDGGFIMSAMSRGLWVAKTNPAGLPEWLREYTPAGYSQSSGFVVRTSDSGYAIIGTALSNGYVTGFDGWLLKLGAIGNVQWSKTYGGLQDDFLSAGQQTSDGGYIVAGNTQSFGSPYDSSNGWVLRLDAQGSVLWQEVFPAQDIFSIDETSDGSFLVAGAVGVAGQADAWLLKLDSEGRVEWQRAYAVPAGNSIIRDHAFSIRQTPDGGYVVGGDVIAWGSSPYLPFEIPLRSYAWVLRLDSQGEIVWQRLFGGGGFTQHVYVSETSDEGFIVSGRFEKANLGGPLVGLSAPFLLKMDAEGNLVWQKIYGGANDFLIQSQQTRDGGIIAVGSLVGGSPNCCDNLAWALKVDSEGNVRGCPVGVQSNATLADTSATVTNTTVASVNTNSTGTPTDVTVTAPPILLVQNQCPLRSQQVQEEDAISDSSPFYKAQVIRTSIQQSAG